MKTLFLCFLIAAAFADSGTDDDQDGSGADDQDSGQDQEGAGYEDSEWYKNEVKTTQIEENPYCDGLIAQKWKMHYDNAEGKFSLDRMDGWKLAYTVKCSESLKVETAKKTLLAKVDVAYETTCSGSCSSTTDSKKALAVEVLDEGRSSLVTQDNQNILEDKVKSSSSMVALMLYTEERTEDLIEAHLELIQTLAEKISQEERGEQENLGEKHDPPAAGEESEAKSATIQRSESFSQTKGQSDQGTGGGQGNPTPGQQSQD